MNELAASAGMDCRLVPVYRMNRMIKFSMSSSILSHSHLAVVMSASLTALNSLPSFQLGNVGSVLNR